MLSKEEILLIIYFVVVILLLTAFVIVFFVVYQRRKNKMLREQFEAKQRFEREISQSRIEMQEQTLKNVGWELHDNIGQLLSIASMQLNVLNNKVVDDNKNNFQEVKKLVADSLTEVRSLSRSLNNEVIDYVGLENSVKNEIERFNRLGVLQARLATEGESYSIKPEDSIILFRILQEFFSNVIKYAGASQLEVKFSYYPEFLEIQAVEDGRGFNISQQELGSGLLNMRSRAEMLHTNFNLNSSVGKGSSLSLRYPTKTNPNEQDDYNR